MEQTVENTPLVYSREKLEALDRQHFPLNLYDGPPKIVRHDEATDQVVIDCECGHGSKEGDMVSLELKHLDPPLTVIRRFAAQFATNFSTCTVLDIVQSPMAVSQCTFATHVFFMANHLTSFTGLERCHVVVG
jgi:hypothetical protein